MKIALDTNVLADLFFADPVFGKPSTEAIITARDEGDLVACPTVWAELVSAFGDRDELLKAMAKLGVSFDGFSPDSSLKAGELWMDYRKVGGKKTRMISDFMIGAHAEIQADRLLSRDRGFFRVYFKNLKVFDPSERG